jgi:hypothetical protein
VEFGSLSCRNTPAPSGRGARVRCVVIAWCDRDTACGKRGPDHRREVTRLGKRLDTRSPLFWSVLPIVEWIELF